MSEQNEVKMGLTEEDVKRRDEGPGIAGLFAAMGDSAADAAAIAASEDGQLIAESAYADACRPGNPRDTIVEEIIVLYKGQL